VSIVGRQSTDSGEYQGLIARVCPVGAPLSDVFRSSLTAKPLQNFKYTVDRAIRLPMPNADG
jgi:hypothetical protein